jgi:acyl-CoA synthetase (AMP-forming)/AMP-acid ligase II
MAAVSDITGWPTIPAMSDATARFGDALAVVDGETRLTYAELVVAARRFAAALVASDVQPADRVAIWCFNSARWIVAALGIWEAGATLVPINTRFKAAEAGDILARSHTRLLVTTSDFLDTDYVALLAGSGLDLSDLETIVVAHGPPAPGSVKWPAFLERAGTTSHQEVLRRAAAVQPEDPSDILFTSGTTGAPKGVVQTHRRTLCVSTDWLRMAELGIGDRYLMVNPYFHMFGLKSGILASVGSGATMFPQAVFDVRQVLETVEREAITVLPGAPTIYQSILDHPDRDRYNLASLRLAVTGAADIPVQLIRRIRADLPFRIVIAGYGLTEAGTATATSLEDDAETIATTVGRARPTFRLRVIDASGGEVRHGEPGEVLLQGGSVMSHYLDDPEATAAVLSSDGWLRTGDIGVLDYRANLRIVGRAKDMFIVGGFNAYPAEIENFLLRHPDVEQVAVIGVPDARLGEVGMAFVVARPGSTPSASAIMAWCRVHMANYKVPRSVEFVDDLPYNATGKVVKDLLRARARPLGAGPSPEAVRRGRA